MSSDWRACTLGDFVRLQRGHDLTAWEQQPGTVPVMGSAGPNGTHDKPLASGPGVVIGRSGASAGRVQFCSVDYWPHNTCLYVTDFRNNSPRFAYYLLQTLNLGAFNSGSAQPSLNRNFLYSIPIRVPPRTAQEEIASVLGSMEDRMALLRETNVTLEATAQALFKSWFVDFDPVRARTDGRPCQGGCESTRTLFPDTWEVWKGRQIPSGWAPRRLQDVLELEYGKALKASERVPGRFRVYGSGGHTGYHDEPMIAGPGIIVGRKGTVGTVFWEDQAFHPIDTVFYVRSANPLTYCFELLKSLPLTQMNTDAAVPGLNRNNAYRLEVVLPTKPVLDAFDEICTPLRALIACNDERVETLSNLRDTLLPRLISGQLRLPEAENLMANV